MTISSSIRTRALALAPAFCLALAVSAAPAPASAQTAAQTAGAGGTVRASDTPSVVQAARVYRYLGFGGTRETNPDRTLTVPTVACDPIDPLRGATSGIVANYERVGARDKTNPAIQVLRYRDAGAARAALREARDRHRACLGTRPAPGGGERGAVDLRDAGLGAGGFAVRQTYRFRDGSSSAEILSYGVRGRTLVAGSAFRFDAQPTRDQALRLTRIALRTAAR